jgi:hypothetical protein
MSELEWKDFYLPPINLWNVWRMQKDYPNLTKRPLKTFTLEEYKVLMETGMFWEFYPEATGNYREDVLGERYPNEYQGLKEFLKENK